MEPQIPAASIIAENKHLSRVITIASKCLLHSFCGEEMIMLASRSLALCFFRRTAHNLKKISVEDGVYSLVMELSSLMLYPLPRAPTVEGTICKV